MSQELNTAPAPERKTIYSTTGRVPYITRKGAKRREKADVWKTYLKSLRVREGEQ